MFYIGKNSQEQLKSVEITRSYEDVCACILMCFGPSDSEDGSLNFQLQINDVWSKPAYLMSDTIFLFSPNKRKFKIQGIPSSRLLLLFYLDESTVNRIQQTDRKKYWQTRAYKKNRKRTGKGQEKDRIKTFF